ncbi:hypothetical protein [Lactococcus lactis]|uniref:hypothetical protein n=1 Tax=Lactococcus lactis TaxID=1358 RepID=UPI0003BEEB49|nr:hypothetical protein [Lactococcus lactis]ESK77999.1 hypothetical protein T211_13975 [Lactococcus lactis subsp. lactis bv. diacetylactis str. LD61]
MALGIFISAGTSVYAAEQIQDSQNQVDKVAKEFEDLFTNGIQINENSYAINSDYLVQNYSSEEISGIVSLIEEISLINNTYTRSKRDIGSFLVCMKDKAVGDLKDMFNVGKFLVFIKTKAWKQAAEFAVKWLAKNGVKRNAVATAALLGWYGVQCAGH